jgi:hypothetical protein
MRVCAHVRLSWDAHAVLSSLLLDPESHGLAARVQSSTSNTAGSALGVVVIGGDS